MILIGSFVAVIFFVLLFGLSLILEKLGYGNVDDIHTIPGLLTYISVIASTLLLTFILLCIVD
jgi:hypothetical protein